MPKAAKRTLLASQGRDIDEEDEDEDEIDRLTVRRPTLTLLCSKLMHRAGNRRVPLSRPREHCARVLVPRVQVPRQGDGQHAARSVFRSPGDRGTGEGQCCVLTYEQEADSC
jgi:hypothetical protein